MIPAASGYGIGPYGTSPYGSGAFALAAGFYVESAILLSANELLVNFSIPFLYQDVINPNNWILRDVTRDVQLEIFGIQPISTFQAIVYLVNPPTPYTHEFTVGGTLQSSMGDWLAPPEAPFIGIDTSDALARLGTQRKDFDLANPFLTETGQPSTLTIASSGDYNVVTGVDLILKLVIRRLIITPGEFVFLPDSYGVGLKVNVPLFLSDLSRLRAQVKLSLQQEPEIASVAVSITLEEATGTLNISIRGKIRKTNAPFSIDVPISSDSISFT